MANVIPIRGPVGNIATRVDTIRSLLLATKRIDEVLSLGDQAKAMQRATKGVEAAREAHNACGELVIECIARVGEELAKMEKARGGRPEKTCSAREQVMAEPMTLAELGIDRKESMRAQRIASIPKEKLQAHFEEVKQSGGEITTAGVLRLAAETAPKAAEPKKKPASAHNPIDLCAMEVRRIVLAAIREMSSDEATALIAELRDELDDIEKVTTERKTSAHHA